jgi:hypothetical protein
MVHEKIPLNWALWRSQAAIAQRKRSFTEFAKYLRHIDAERFSMIILPSAMIVTTSSAPAE